jgi:hypothetical protein
MKKFIKTFTLCISVFIFSKCSSPSEEANAFKTIGSITNKTGISKITVFSPENYKVEAEEILERGKRRIKDTLPIMIKNQLSKYLITIEDLEKLPILSYSLDESNKKEIEVRKALAIEMIENEVEINKIYYEVANELTLLNSRYYKYFNDQMKSIQFRDYYEVSPFVLSSDVAQKFDEFYSEIRIKDNTENTIDGALLLASLVPMGTGIKGVQFGYLGIVAISTAEKTGGKMTLEYLKQKVKNSFDEGAKLAQKQINSDKAITHIGDLNPAFLIRTQKKIKDIHKGVQDRLYDFSDGIISQPIGNLRKVIEKNVDELASLDKFPEGHKSDF